MEEQLLYVMRRKLRNHNNLLELFITAICLLNTGTRLVSLFCRMEVETALLIKGIHRVENPFINNMGWEKSGFGCVLENAFFMDSFGYPRNFVQNMV